MLLEADDVRGHAHEDVNMTPHARHVDGVEDGEWPWLALDTSGVQHLCHIFACMKV